MRIVLWHGYLLGGTGSNVYTRALAREWSRAGHEVVVLSQEPHPELYDLGGARHVRPEIGGVLPSSCSTATRGSRRACCRTSRREERDRYVELNAEAVRAELPADLVFANHVLLGGPVGAASGARYAVKAHGSELEYSMRGNPELQAWGRESLARRRGRLRRLAAHPPGAGGGRRPRRPRPRGPARSGRRRVPAREPRAQALAALVEEARRDPPNDGNERLPDPGNAERLAEFLAEDEPTVVYFGKLLYNKGVHLLLEALRELDARAVIVGFGDYREELERLAPPRTLFTGPLEHRHLVHLLPLADVTVVPSIFPEAFGMVAAEAAAAGSPPLVARHSGLQEIAEGLEAEYPPEYRHLTSFATGDVGT